MKLGAVPVLFLYMAGASSQASATVATLGVSKQPFTLTGIGKNASGQGQSKMTWGTCAFDGSNTNCTLSGAFTGFGGGGNYSFLISYPGNGAFPLIAVTNPALEPCPSLLCRYSVSPDSTNAARSSCRRRSAGPLLVTQRAISGSRRNDRICRAVP